MTNESRKGTEGSNKDDRPDSLGDPVPDRPDSLGEKNNPALALRGQFFDASDLLKEWGGVPFPKKMDSFS